LEIIIKAMPGKGYILVSLIAICHCTSPTALTGGASACLSCFYTNIAFREIIPEGLFYNFAHALAAYLNKPIEAGVLDFGEAKLVKSNKGDAFYTVTAPRPTLQASEKIFSTDREAYRDRRG
jgi:hypothetical protein